MGSSVTTQQDLFRLPPPAEEPLPKRQYLADGGRWAEPAEDDSPYRLVFGRRWALGGTGALFCMLNPSKASFRLEDNTIRRCEDFARAWGNSWFEVVNMFSLRSTDPKALRTAADAIGPGNDEAILAAARRANIIILAPGKQVLRGFDERLEHVTRLLASVGDVYCLQKTEDGRYPRHPLMLKKSCVPTLYRAKGE